MSPGHVHVKKIIKPPPNIMKYVARFSEILGVAALIFNYVFSSYLERNRPYHPTRLFTVQLPIHGDFVYISNTEYLIKIGGWSLFFVSLVASIVFEQLSKIDRQ
jgi:hypothetical protein